jgi:3-carboxy-cis,cis-muconate cycloisomerase
VLSNGGHLIDLLAERTDVAVDWTALRDPAGQLGAAEAFIERVLVARRRAAPQPPR